MSNIQENQVQETINALRHFAAVINGNRRTSGNYINQRSFLTQTIQDNSR